MRLRANISQSRIHLDRWRENALQAELDQSVVEELSIRETTSVPVRDRDRSRPNVVAERPNKNSGGSCGCVSDRKSERRPNLRTQSREGARWAWEGEGGEESGGKASVASPWTEYRAANER